MLMFWFLAFISKVLLNFKILSLFRSPTYHVSEIFFVVAFAFLPIDEPYNSFYFHIQFIYFMQCWKNTISNVNTNPNTNNKYYEIDPTIIEEKWWRWKQSYRKLPAFLKLDNLIKLINETKDKVVFKNGPSKICGRQLLRNLKWYGLL